VPRVFDTDHFARRFLDLIVPTERVQLGVKNGGFGSGADENPTPRLRLPLRAKRTFSAEKQTINF
jgi:hypothetical protein